MSVGFGVLGLRVYAMSVAVITERLGCRINDCLVKRRLDVIRCIHEESLGYAKLDYPPSGS